MNSFESPRIQVLTFVFPSWTFFCGQKILRDRLQLKLEKERMLVTDVDGIENEFKLKNQFNETSG